MKILKCVIIFTAHRSFITNYLNNKLEHICEHTPWAHYQWMNEMNDIDVTDGSDLHIDFIANKASRVYQYENICRLPHIEIQKSFMLILSDCWAFEPDL